MADDGLAAFVAVRALTGWRVRVLLRPLLVAVGRVVMIGGGG